MEILAAMVMAFLAGVAFCEGMGTHALTFVVASVLLGIMGSVKD